MSTDVFSLHCDALDDAKLVGFKGVELLSRPFEFDVFFTVPLGTDVKGAVGARASLIADRDDGRGPMAWHGIFAAVRLLHETAERALYRASLVPRSWLLQHHVRSFVHTKKKIDVWSAATLKHGGLSTADFAFHTHAGAYPSEEFVCQYRESHLDFLHRWFEREGLYYYFEHPEAAGAAEKMVIVDDRAHHPPLLGKGTVRYVPAAGTDHGAGECLRELHADFRLLPASVLISDYNYANPSAPLAGEKAVSGVGQGQIREYGYRVFDEKEAARLAAVKAQSIACRELTITATGDVLGLRAGYTFQVEDAPADLPAKYLAIEVRHAGAVAGTAGLVRRYTGLDPAETYRVDVVAIPESVQFRAAQTTPWPRIYGFENGTVDGPTESQYAQIDDMGRYLVRFKFDASDLPDGSTSTYLRMMQPHGGSTEGWHFPLRKGTEVMVSFQGGDPDRPVIAGVVPNALTPSNVTSKNFTQNVLRTGGANEIIMDDIDGAQLISVSTPIDKTGYTMGGPIRLHSDVPPHDPAYADEPKNLQASYSLQTDGSAGFIVGQNWLQLVGGNHWFDVTKEGRTRYGARHTLIIVGASDEFYQSVRNTTINSGRTDKVLAGGMGQEINGGFFQKVSPAGKQEVTGDWFHQVGGENHDKYGAWSTTVAGKWTATSGGDISMKSTGGNVTINSSSGEVVITGSTKISLVAPKVDKITGSCIDTTDKSMQFFGFAGTFGIAKYDFAATAFGHTGLSMSATVLKAENVGAQVGRTITELNDTATKILNGALGIFSLGLTKL